MSKIKFKSDDKVKIINGGEGAYGCNGSTGAITDKKSTNGSSKGGINVKLDNGATWGMGLNYKFELIKTPNRTWKTDVTIKSSDGIEVAKDKITIVSGVEFTPEEAKEELNQLRKALDQHSRHFK